MTTDTSRYESVLRECGLFPNEIKIFLALLKHGPQTATKIAESSGISRTNAYHILASLEDKKLIKRAKIEKKTLFEPEHPQRILDNLSEQEAELKRRRNQLDSIFEEMVTEYRLNQTRPGIFRFEGKEGLTRAYDEQLKDRAHISVFMNRTIFRNFLGDYNTHFIRQRKKHRIRTRVLTTCGRKFDTPDEIELREVRYINPNACPFEMDFRMTKKKLVMSTFKENVAAGIVITDPEICKNFLALFDYLWQQSPTAPKKEWALKK